MAEPLSVEQQRILMRFPFALQALVKAELEAGNAIIDAGAGHPAPPAGDMIKLAHDLSTPVPEGITAYARNSSMHHTEITDDERFFFVLTAAHPPPPPPAMDAIRNARSYEPPPEVEVTHEPYSIEMDFRGEMLIYHEPDRRTDIIWTWSQDNHFYLSSLTHWWYPKERRSVPLTPEEKEVVLEKFLHYGHTHIGSNITVVE